MQSITFFFVSSMMNHHAISIHTYLVTLNLNTDPGLITPTTSCSACLFKLCALYLRISHEYDLLFQTYCKVASASSFEVLEGLVDFDFDLVEGVDLCDSSEAGIEALNAPWISRPIWSGDTLLTTPTSNYLSC